MRSSSTSPACRAKSALPRRLPTLRTLNVLDAFTRECLAIEVDTSLTGARVVRVLEALIAKHGKPDGITSTTAEFISQALDQPGKPVQNAHESFNSRSRDKCLAHRARSPWPSADSRDAARRAEAVCLPAAFDADASYRETFATIQALHTFAIHDVTFSREQHVQAPVAEARPQRSELAHTRHERGRRRAA